jgi:4-hydroxy-L-threonine phosphate dehydrogenase PdxA
LVSYEEEKYVKHFRVWMILAAAMVLLLTACGPQEVSVPATGVESAEAEAAGAAMLDLADRTGVNIAEVQVVSIQQTEWMDACLELGQPGESCAQVVVPGYRVVLEVEGQQYVYHTDMLGDSLRQSGFGQ